MSNIILKAEALQEFADLYSDAYRYIVYYSGRSTGKSFAVADWQVTEGLTKRLKFLDCREYQTSIKDSVKAQLESCINRRNLAQYFTIGRDEIRCDLTGSTWSFIGMHNNTQTVKSYEGIDVCWVEEAQTVTMDSLKTLLPTIRKPGSRLVFTMNRLTDADPVYQYFTETPPPKTLVRYLDPLTLDRYGLQPQAMKELRESQKNDRDYAYTWLGEPLAQIDNAILPRDELVAAFDRHGDSTGGWVVGVDVARFGADRTVFVARKGLEAKALEVMTKTPITAQVERLREFVADMDGARIHVDDTGVGGGFTDLARAEGLDVTGVNFAQKPKVADRYPTAASEMWFDFADILGKVGLSELAEYRPDLLSELSQRSWSFDANGRRVVEQKSAYKSAGNRSPDLADALLLAYYEPRQRFEVDWGW